MSVKSTAIAFGALIVGASGLFVLLSRRKRTRSQLADSNEDVLAVAADAFLAHDIKRGEQILEELPEADRPIARCIRATKKRWKKGPNWKGWEQVSHYRLYKPLVMEPMYGRERTPENFPYTKVTINASKTTDTNDGMVTDWITVLGDLGPTEAYPEGEYRYLRSGQQDSASHSQALRELGYPFIIPCSNVPLSGRLRRKPRRIS